MTRRYWLPILASLLLCSPFAMADLPKWELSRTSSPDSPDELKALQVAVKDVQKKTQSATVGLLLGGEEERKSGMSCGSGVIVSEDGLVLTAAHVIMRPNEPIVFVLADGKHVAGVSLGLNTTNDSGMARITDKAPKDYPGAKDGKWPFVSTGPSDGLKKGQWIVSLGHPGGPKQDRPPPVRVGRYLSYDKSGFGQRNDLLCTDATLVGGDSGGPLFTLDGKCVGIHSEIGETLDVNRHVPMEKFTAEWERMVEGQMIFRTNSERDRATTVAMNVTFDESIKDRVRLEAVAEGGTAEKAGLKVDDIILRVNDRKVGNYDEIRGILPSFKVGQKLKLGIKRGDETIEVTVKLVARKR